jgi:hypothetical protein
MVENYLKEIPDSIKNGKNGGENEYLKNEDM